MTKSILLIGIILISSCVESYDISRLNSSNSNNQDTVYLADYYLSESKIDCKNVKEIAYIAANSEIKSDKFYELLELSITCNSSSHEIAKLADDYDLGLIDIDSLNKRIKEYRSLATYSSIEDAIKNN